MKNETPYQYHDNKLGVKIKFLVADKKIRHQNSLNLITRRSLSNRMTSKTCTEIRLRRASLGNDALVEFNSLDIAWRNLLTATFGEPKKEIQKSYFAKHYEKDSEAYNYFCGYRFGDNGTRKLDAEVIELYTHNASVLNTVLKVKANRKAYAKALGVTNINIWETLSRDVNAFNEVYHDLPTTAGSLRHKVTRYRKEKYQALISGKYGNANRIKVKDVEQKALIDELLAKHTNLDNELIASLYNTIANHTGWDTITAGTVANYKKKSKLATYAGRNGAKPLKHNVLMQNKRRRPSGAMLFWSLDGWDVELAYQKTSINSKGQEVTTYHNRLTAVIVLDAFNDYPIGYAIGTHETPELITLALQNALQHTQELFGVMYKPYQVQSDNYSIKKLRPTYEAITKHFTPAEVGNAKAKPVEPYFNLINKKYCRLMDNWSGYNVSSGSANQPNSEYLNKIRHRFPTQDEFVKQIVSIIDMERQNKQSKLIASYDSVASEHKHTMSWHTYMQIFGETTGFTNKLTGEGINIKINGIEHYYDSFNKDFRKHFGESWRIVYDRNNLQKVLAISSDEKYAFELEEKHQPAMCIADRTPEDVEHLTKVARFNKEIVDDIIEERANNMNVLKDFFNDNPQLNDTVAKHLLVDSLGQHKNHKSEQRQLNAQAQALVFKNTAKEEQQKQKTFVEKQQEYYNSKIDITQYLK